MRHHLALNLNLKPKLKEKSHHQSGRNLAEGGWHWLLAKHTERNVTRNITNIFQNYIKLTKQINYQAFTSERVQHKVKPDTRRNGMGYSSFIFFFISTATWPVPDAFVCVCVRSGRTTL